MASVLATNQGSVQMKALIEGNTYISVALTLDIFGGFVDPSRTDGAGESYFPPFSVLGMAGSNQFISKAITRHLPHAKQLGLGGTPLSFLLGVFR